MREITLRQIEVIRAVMLRGTINGAAEHLNVSAPGVSRLIKHAEQSLGVRLFERKAGLFIPSVESKNIFDQIGEVYRGVENLQTALSSLKRGSGANLAFASAPSVASFVTTRAVRKVREKYPDLYVDLNIVKYDEALEYVLLEQGEFALMTSAVDNPGVQQIFLGRVPMRVVLPFDHPLEVENSISVEQLANEKIIGVDPLDPYGAQLFQPFVDAGMGDLEYSTRGRFSQTVIAFVREKQGVAVVDELSVLNPELCGVTVRPLEGEYTISIYAVTKTGRSISTFATDTIETVRRIVNGEN